MGANPQRGDVELVINGEARVMRLTLGALAALEDRLEAGSLMGLAERFESQGVRSTDLLALLAAGLGGAGDNADLDEAALASAHIEGGAVAALGAGMTLLSRAFVPAGDDPEG